jgi:hypothetical protein
LWHQTAEHGSNQLSLGEIWCGIVGSGAERGERARRVRRRAHTRFVDFWDSLAVEIPGGIVTALFLGLGAAVYAASQQVRHHDERVADLEEDNRRWFRDRDAQVERETRRATNELASIAQHTAGALLNALEAVRRQALHEYRDEMSAKRRRYRELREAEGRLPGMIRRRRGPLRRFALAEGQRSILDSWRSDIQPPSTPGASHPVDDPTRPGLEPDLRRFEAEGDPPL